MDAEELAAEIWAYGSNDLVWAAMFDPSDPGLAPYKSEDNDIDQVELAGEFLTKIEASPDFVVGDLTNEQVKAAIVRRYPILGPPPGCFKV